MEKFRRLFAYLLPLLLVAVMLAGTAQAALLDFGPIVPEVVGSTPPNLQTGFPLWYRDTNRVPLELCLVETPGCLFAAVDRPNLDLPLAFPNIPDELFYYSAQATIPNAIENQLLFAGVEMNFAENADGTYEQVGFSRVRIRISTTVPGDYTVTTPWKQYFFTVDQATITATGGRRVINATEDIGLGPDGVFSGALAGTIGPYVYSQGAPFVTAAGTFLGTGLPLTVTGSTYTDPFNDQPANIFRIEGPPSFGMVFTDQFAITGKLYLTAPTPTPLTVDKVTYALDNSGIQVNAFATTEALSNQTNSALPFPQNFALTEAPSVLQLTGAGFPNQNMSTNNPGDGKFFSASGLFTTPDPIPATVTVTNTNDVPPTVKTVPLVDEVVITNASYNLANSTLSIAASSFDKVANPALQAFIPGMTASLGTLSNGVLDVTFPVTDSSVNPSKTYLIPPASVSVVSAIGGTATAPVTTFLSAAGYSITSAAAPNGAISPTGVTSVAAGANQTYTITPAAGFKVDALVVDGTVLPGATSYTFTNVAADHYINAYFTEQTFTVTASAGANGAISPAGVSTVVNGSALGYTVTANAGFQIASLTVDGVVLPVASSYTFTSITGNHTISATFAPIPANFTITSAAAPNGAISPAGANVVAQGNNQTFTITPNAGFAVTALVVDGVQLPGATSYTFTNVAADHYINAYFVATVPANVTITSAAAPNGTISPAGANVFAGGTDQTYTITPDNGLTVTNLVVDGAVLPGATSYTFTNVTTDHYINAYFGP